MEKWWYRWKPQDESWYQPSSIADVMSMASVMAAANDANRVPKYQCGSYQMGVLYNLESARYLTMTKISAAALMACFKGCIGILCLTCFHRS